MDDKMALYRDCCFPNCKTMVNKVTFVGFRGSDRLNLPLLDPPLYPSLRNSTVTRNYLNPLPQRASP